MEKLTKVPEAEANTWVATEYRSEYGSKIGVTDEYYDEPIHMVLAGYITKDIRVMESNAGGVTIREYRKNGTWFCERRLYLVVREDK